MRLFGRFLGRFLIGALAVVGLLVIAVVVGLWVAVSRLDMAGQFSEPLPDQMVLHLPFHRAFPEGDPGPFAGGFGEAAQISAREAVAALDAAADDPRVVGVVASIGDSGRGMAQAQDLRAAVARFRASGKPAVAFADTLGEGSGAPIDYYLATSFDTVWLQPSGTLSLSGFGIEVPFVREALEAIGVATAFGARHEFKNAMDPAVRESMSDAHRASLRDILESWTAQVVDGIATARDLDPAAVGQLVGGVPLFAEDALAAGLVDRLGYWDQLLDELRERTGQVSVATLAGYAQGIDPAGPVDGATIALVRVTGPIQRGTVDPSPFAAEDGAGGDSVARALRDAVDDPDVRAIVLRIDSPGGSYVASDTIWREVQRARDRNVPVIASLGDMAASGGYFAAMGAERIIAQPGTITGSIGVFALKPVLTDLWDKLNISWDSVEVGDHALMWSPNRPFSAAEQAWFDRMLDTIYADFTTKVGEARGLSAAQVDGVARGRVFTGAQAHALGLVDGLGGLREAVAEARQAAGMAPDAPVRLEPWPRRATGWAAVFDLLGGDEAPISALGTLIRLGVALGPAADALAPIAARARVAADGPALMLPEGLAPR